MYAFAYLSFGSHDSIMKLSPVFFTRLSFAIFQALFFQELVCAMSVATGENLDKQKCYECHAKKVAFGDGDLIYTRSDRKVKSMANLSRMVSLCNSELRLDLFPEDEADLVLYLNQSFYKFK